MVRLKRVLSGHDGRIFRLAWSPDGSFLATPSEDATIRIWHADSGCLVATLQGHTGEVNDAAWSADGRLLATVGDDGRLIFWDLANHELLHSISAHSVDANSVAFSPEGSKAITVADSPQCAIWDVQTGNQVGELTGHSHPVWTCRWSPTGQWVSTGSDDETIRLWNLERGETRILRGHASTVRSLAWFPDGTRLLSGSRDATVRVWDVDFPEAHHVLQGHSRLVTSVSVSHCGKVLASKSTDETVRIWQSIDGELIEVLHEPSGGRWSSGLAFSPTSNILATLTEKDRAVRLWEYQAAELPSPDNVRKPGIRKVFLSYSHADEPWMQRLRTMLAPLERQGVLSFWVDTDIRLGDEWRNEIEAALASSVAAVLLVSPEFLASRFIADIELPVLLRRVQQDGLRLIWIPIRESLHEASGLDGFQAATRPSRPLESLEVPAQNAVFASVCRELRELVGLDPSESDAKSP
jgi:Tol biopolymer transport system component